MLRNLWHTASNDKSKWKLFYNCINRRLLLSPMNVLLLCPPQTLHLKLYFLEWNKKVGMSLTPKLQVVLQHLEEIVGFNGSFTMSADAQANENFN